ncbi:alpha/beta hydrolase [Massilia sp. METH4]|uniref:alpha/beta hydrolase family protein n=1 Tax=Massilia sp. METH4 TaxID=3123041 RepID=UPI0030CE39D6
MTAPMTLQDYLALTGPGPDASFAYGSAPSQYVELFLPPGVGPFPCVVLVHGGCWTAQYGGITQMRSMAGALIAQGIAVWNVEYRRHDEEGGGYPGTYLDVTMAIERLRDEPRIDLQRIVAVGHSAGGHLAQWAASRHKLPPSSPAWVPDPVRIPTVISLGGLADLRDQAALIRSSCERETVQLAGLPSAGRPDVFADTSPAEMLPAGIHTVLIHGELDIVSPPSVAEAYARRARAAGDTAEVIVLPGAGHYDEVAAGAPCWPLVNGPILRALGLQ